MSITVSDLLKLPSLSGAEVVAGAGGLSRIVASISVLEYADPDILQDSLFHNNEFFGSEIVITGFMNVKDDIECQCANIRRLAAAGEVGLILYYVGIFMPYIDQKLIDLANELDFTLICMPKNRMDLRYSEVICEVMEAIFKSQDSTNTLVTEVLARVSVLPQHQHTVDTVMKMLSDRIKASIVLTDASMRVLNEIAWPRALDGVLSKGLKTAALPPADLTPIPCSLEQDSLLYRAVIGAERFQKMNLFCLKKGMPLEETLLRQTVEAVNLAVNLWSKQHDEVAITELVRAILQDEPMKMRSLADIFHVDVASIHTMWVLHACRDQKKLADQVSAVKELAEPYCDTIVADIYQGDLVLFMDDPPSLQDADALMDEVFSHFNKNRVDITITRCHNLDDTTEVRSAFLANQTHLRDAQKIFPVRNSFDLSDIRFAQSCREQAEQGEQAIQKDLIMLQALDSLRGELHLRETLAIFLLDAYGSVTTAARLMFLHKNTVKYRLRRIADQTGYHVNNMTESMILYRAAALGRLLQPVDKPLTSLAEFPRQAESKSYLSAEGHTPSADIKKKHPGPP